MKDITGRIVVVTVGLALMGLGISLYVRSGLGGDPLTVLAQGISRSVGLSIGGAIQLINVGVILALLIWDRKSVGLATIANLLLVGPFTNVSLGLVPQAGTMLASVVCLVLGVILLGTGIGVYVSGQLGEGAVEALMMLAHDKLGLQVKWIRIAIDAVSVIAGVFLGGTVGVGTLLGILATGPVAQITMKACSARAPQRLGMRQPDGKCLGKSA